MGMRMHWVGVAAHCSAQLAAFLAEENAAPKGTIDKQEIVHFGQHDFGSLDHMGLQCSKCGNW